MSASAEWLNARYTEVEKFSRPDTLSIGGQTNEVAAITIMSAFDGDGIIVQGRPEDLVRVAREFLAAAEEIVVETTRDPALRSLYGIVVPGAEPHVTRSVAGLNSLPRVI